MFFLAADLFSYWWTRGSLSATVGWPLPQAPPAGLDPISVEPPADSEPPSGVYLARACAWTATSSLDDAAQHTAKQNCLFGNRQTNAHLLAHLFGQQTLNRASFRWAPLLHSLVGDPGTGKAISRFTARSANSGRTKRIWMPWAFLEKH